MVVFVIEKREHVKKFFKSKMAVSLMAGWFILSGAGYLGKDNIYRNYSLDAVKTPYFVLVLQGLHDHVYPWDMKWDEVLEHYPKQMPNHVLAKEVEDVEQESLKDVESTESTQIPETEEVEAVRREFAVVEQDYFEDAVFIGDSRTVGLRDYGGLENTDFFATVGMNVYDLWTDKFCELNGEKVTLEEALSAKQYGKVYFQIGINEMGRGTIDGFMEKYAQSLEKIEELQPTAMIYLQGIMKVTKAKSDSDAIFNNEGIQARNERIADLADGKNVFYIDVNEVVCDENGGLKESLTFDNLHLYASKYDIWVDFLKTKGIKDVE